LTGPTSASLAAAATFLIRTKELMSSSGERLRQLYERFAGELHQVARRRVHPDESWDLVHDTFTRFATFAGDKDLHNPGGYLFRIAHNAALDARQRAAIPVISLESAECAALAACTVTNPERIVIGRTALERMKMALDELPARYRHALVLHRFAGLSQAEVARTMNLPQRTAERYIAKAFAHCIARVDL
jgi:RNA polymerase sigma factor (sigma-70 family)